MDKQTMGTFDDSNSPNPQYSIFGGLQFPPTSPLSTLAAAQYRPVPGATFPNPAASAPGPLAIPSAQPPIFLSPPDPSNAASAPPPNPLGSLGSAITNGISNHALTLMALGAGIAQGGVGKGLADAATAAAAERNRQLQQLNLLQTYKALTDGGVPPQEAQAAIGNPSLMRALAAKYLGPRSPGAIAPVSNASPTPGSAPSGLAPNYRGNAPRVAALGATAFPPVAPALPAATAPENGPLTFSNPFDFSNADLQGNYLWNKLMFDPRPLPSNSFFLGNPDPGSDLFSAAPLNPPGGSPIVPTKFR
jgi:hypothetical protein